MWRQTLGSAIHCVAGDGIGILVGAVTASLSLMSMPVEIALKYVLGFGFGFGWTTFQSLFMKGMAGGSYTKALRTTFLPEFLSMNWLMAAMVPVATLFRTRFPEAQHPGNAAFWFAMSVAPLAGFVVAYPINWWLVSHHFKHGMLTVRPDASEERHGSPKDGLGGAERKATTSVGWLVAMTSVSLVVLALELFVAGQIAAHG